MFNFTSLLGARCSSPASQSLLELEGGVKILIDVGWDESFDVELLNELEKQVPTLSFILLTHATTHHLAAFAHCCKHIQSFTTIPVYATAPVVSLGRSLLQDLYTSTPLASSIIPRSSLYESASLAEGASSNILLQPPTSDEIANYFSQVHRLKYSQPHEPLASPLSPPLNGLTITAYSAGHSLGGTIWHIQHGLESIVYAVDWNQAKESALLGAAWLGAGGGEVIESLRRPTALVCSSRASQRVVLPGGRAKRDEFIVSLIRSTIRSGGTIVIPSDSCARALEMAYFLDGEWHRDSIKRDNETSLTRAKLFFASASASSTIRYARSMIEWMDEDVVREFESATAAQTGGQSRQQENQHGQKGPRAPFDFRFMRILERSRQVDKVLSQQGPKVILATDTSVEWGLSRRIIKAMAEDSRNLIILPEIISHSSTNSTSSTSVGNQLWRLWSEQVPTNDERAMTTIVETNGTSIPFNEVEAQSLDGNELILYQQYLARQLQRQKAMTVETGTAMEARADVMDDSSSGSSESEESDSEHQGRALNVSTTLSHSRNKVGLSDAELGIDILIRRKGHHDYDVRGKRGRERIFPVLTSKRNQRTDDFGDVIRPEDYLRAEEREILEAQNLADDGTGKEPTLGQKRKWNEATSRTGTNGHLTNINAKRHRANEGLDGNSSRMDLDGVAANGDWVGHDSDESDDDDVEPSKGGPRKVGFVSRTLSLNIRIAYVDFSGLHDKRAMQMLIPMIRPRKLVLIGGQEKETMSLAAECAKLLSVESKGSGDHDTEIFTPVIGETIDVSVDTNAWNVKLSLPLRKQLHWQNVGGLGVVPLTSHLGIAPPDDDGHAEESKAKRHKNGTDLEDSKDNPADGEANLEDKQSSGVPLLDVVPANMAAATRILARPFHVGDLRLSDLRKLMQTLGYSAEFRGEGTLLVNGMVVVRKSAVGKIEVEVVIGLPGFSVNDPTFDDVRRKIYEGLAIVEGA